MRPFRIEVIGNVSYGDVFTLLDVDEIIGTYDQIIAPGNVDTSMLLIDGTVMAIPEPMTMLAVGLGISGLGGYIRKRRRG